MLAINLVYDKRSFKLHRSNTKFINFGKHFESIYIYESKKNEEHIWEHTSMSWACTASFYMLICTSINIVYQLIPLSYLSTPKYYCMSSHIPHWQIRVFLTKFFVGGLAFGDNFRSPSDSWGSRRGQSQMRGTWKNCPLRPKNAPYSKIRANFGVLSITFLMQFWVKK